MICCRVLSATAVATQAVAAAVASDMVVASAMVVVAVVAVVNFMAPVAAATVSSAIGVCICYSCYGSCGLCI
jgi:hypothetical protein